jgi:predicted acylesterase/phospholipase RssA
MVERTFGAAAIEELERGFICASADLRAAELVVHRHGPLARWVLTSMTVPMLGPPNVEGRRILVDGSLIDNLPIATIAALGEGPIIAVDVKASFERPRVAEGAEDGGAAGQESDGRGSRPSRRRSTGWGGPPPPPLGETLTRAFLLASSNTSAAARRHASLVVKPRNEGVGLLEFHQIDRAIEAGRAAAREALPNAPAEIWS